VVYKGISETGGTVELFLTPEQEEAYGLSEQVVAEQVTIDEVFKAETIVDIQFNERGRVDSVRVTAE